MTADEKKTMPPAMGDLLRAVLAVSGLVTLDGSNADLHDKGLITVGDTDDGEVGTVLTEHARKLIGDALQIDSTTRRATTEA